MKKLHWLLIKTFFGPFLGTFVISLFLFLMQALWKYLPDLIGKGIEFLVILEFISYLVPHVLPYALPLTVLLSSIMAFGNLGERYELVAIKSAGIGLLKMMMPLTIVMVMLSAATFYSANVLIPKANLQWGSLLYDLTRKKPAMNITDGVFFKGIDGYSIRVGKKHKDNKTLEDVLIYSKGADNLTNDVIVAKKGTMQFTENQRFLLLELYEGKQYVEMVKAKDYHKNMPHNVMQFETYFLAIDLSDLALTRTDPGAFKDDYRMLDIDGLDEKKDSFDSLIERRLKYLSSYMKPFFNIEIDSNKKRDSFYFDQKNLRPYASTIGEFEAKKNRAIRNPKTEKGNRISRDSMIKRKKSKRFVSRIQDKNANHEVIEELSIPDSSMMHPIDKQERTMREQVLELAIRNARNMHNEIEQSIENIKSIESTKARYEGEIHKKYALAFSCLLLFFVGAPLGAIIRRGGFGLPLVIAIVLFIIYYIINEIGAKTARQGVIEVWVGAWLSTLILAPIAIFLTTKANSDSKVFDADSYKVFFQKLFSKKN